MPRGGGEHDFWPLGVEIVPGSKTPYLIDRNLLIDFHKVLYRTLVICLLGLESYQVELKTAKQHTNHANWSPSSLYAIGEPRKRLNIAHNRPVLW